MTESRFAAHPAISMAVQMTSAVPVSLARCVFRVVFFIMTTPGMTFPQLICRCSRQRRGSGHWAGWFSWFRRRD